MTAMLGSMAFESDSLPRRTLGPTIASGAIGIALGIVAIVGASLISNANAVAEHPSVSAEHARLGDPEYGSRN